MPRRCLLHLADDLLDLLTHGVQADPQRLKRLRRYTLALMDEAEQDVLGADVVVIEHPGFFLRQDDNPPRPVSKSLEHLVALLTARARSTVPSKLAPCLPRMVAACPATYLMRVQHSRLDVPRTRGVHPHPTLRMRQHVPSTPQANTPRPGGGIRA